MTLPLPVSGGDEADAGSSYGAVLIAAEHAASDAIDDVVGSLRFSGWIAPPSEGWHVIVGDPGAGVVADRRRGVIDVAALLATRVTGPVFAFRVRRDRQLAIVAWRNGREIGRYSSDPSQEPGADAEVLSAPFGVASGVAFAEAVGQADAARELVRELEEELDPESVFESERLRRVLRLLGMPGWLVAAGALPRDIATGPRVRDLRRVRVGRTGVAGMLIAALVRRARRRHAPPPVFADPPRGFGGMSGIEPWMF